MYSNRKIDLEQYKKLNETARHPMPVVWSGDWDSGDFQYQPGWGYFYQDLWCAQKIYENKPASHVDVGSSVWGFISHLLSFRKDITLVDVRPMDSDMEGVRYICSDATDLKEFDGSSVESLSALCSVEHFGLGRYGDAINPDGWHQALRSFVRLLSQNGRLYFSVPVGAKNQLCFNAHRVFTFEKIVNTVPDLELTEFSFVFQHSIEKLVWRENGALVQSDVLKNLDKQLGSRHGIGLFEFVKRA